MDNISGGSRACTGAIVNNTAEDNVIVIFVPAYLDGRDGIFNLESYDTLIGFDVQKESF